jgi:hypothetical protein
MAPCVPLQLSLNGTKLL